MKKKKMIILGICLFLVSFGVSAATVMYSANNVTYSSSSLAGNNVQDALDNLISKCETSTTTCPSGMTCTDKTNIKCKRATTLHTEICNNTGNKYCCSAKAGYTNGETITYGNTTTIDGVLTPGDAFDCDVNGDNIYDAITERFYYVYNYYDTSTMKFNDKIAVLAYYSNVRGGVSSTQSTVYHSNNINYVGPITAIEQLPTTSQWNNVRLYKETRQILSSERETSVNGRALPTAFSYEGYSARLLTSQEVDRGCKDYAIYEFGTKCLFLLENTKFSDSSSSSFGSLLETPTDSSADVLKVHSESVGVYGTNAANYSGVRPVIEVPKSEILY